MRWSLLMPLALIVGLLIPLVDSSLNRDDTGISAAAVFVRCVASGAAAYPKRAWQWALAVGLWIPVLGIALRGNYESWTALIVPFAGVTQGRWYNRSLSGPRRTVPVLVW